jgi:hypothetical protein
MQNMMQKRTPPNHIATKRPLERSLPCSSKLKGRALAGCTPGAAKDSKAAGCDPAALLTCRHCQRGNRLTLLSSSLSASDNSGSLAIFAAIRRASSR